MKKINFLLYIFLVIVLMFLYCSCGFSGDQEYFCEIDQVKSIQIVRLDKYVEGEYRYEYTILSQISDLKTFVERLNNLKHSVNWGEPMQLDIQYVVIRINYFNGDYDLIHPNAQCFNRGGTNNYGYFFFDSNQFNKLISDYFTEYECH